MPFLTVFSAHTIFYVLILFVAYCCHTSFALCVGLNERWANVFGFTSIFFGWPLNAIILGNYDNLVFYSIFPIPLIFLFKIWNDVKITFLGILFGGISAAALIYTYPEGIIFSSLCAFPLLLFIFMRIKEKKMVYLSFAVTGILAGVLLTPFLQFLVPFVLNQINAGSLRATPPGSGNFPGLISGRFLQSFIALGGEYPNSHTNIALVVISLIFLLYVVIGIKELSKKNGFILPSSLLCLAALVFTAYIKRYDYAVYKILICNSWFFLWCFFSGALNSVKWSKIRCAKYFLLFFGITAFACRNHLRENRV